RSALTHSARRLAKLLYSTLLRFQTRNGVAHRIRRQSQIVAYYPKPHRSRVVLVHSNIAHYQSALTRDTYVIGCCILRPSNFNLSRSQCLARFGSIHGIFELYPHGHAVAMENRRLDQTHGRVWNGGCFWLPAE